MWGKLRGRNIMSICMSCECDHQPPEDRDDNCGCTCHREENQE